MQMSALSILNAIRERPLSAGQFGTASARFWPRIAVGTLITKRPPHRTERARFGHSAPTLGV
jgi:hypothetical protein